MKKSLIFFFILITLIVSYYLLNDSYRISLEAKAYFELGNYKKAYKLSNEAYKLNKYNNQAFTILTQSKIAKVWQDYINESNEYFMQINSISNKDIIKNDDKIRIKMMLEIIIGEFKNLPQSKLLNKDLKNQAQNNYKKAKELYNGIFKKTTK